MVLSQADVITLKLLFKEKGWRAKRIVHEFPEKGWTEPEINGLIRKIEKGDGGGHLVKEQLCDLHVYRVPHELWRDSFNNILNNAITETISIGIIRVPYELRLVDVREEIVQQLQLDDLLPRDFVFLRSVGRSLTTLRGKQEFQLKAKHFLPPVAYSPELYILEVTPEIRDALAISDRFSQSPQSRRGSPNTQRGYNNSSSYRNGYHGGSDTDRGRHSNRQPASPPHSVNKYEPLPHISDHSPYPQETHSDPSNFYHHNNQPPQSSSYRHQQYPPSHADKQPDNATYRKEYPDTLAPPPPPPPQQQQPSSPQPEHRQTYNNNNDSDRVWEQGHRASPPGVKSDLPRSSDKGSNRRLDDDSGVGELSRSPDDDYNRRGGRDSRRLPNHLDSSTFALEDLSEDEKRRRLEEIQNQNELDRQRWNQDQDDRRRQTMDDQRRAEEELRHRDEIRRKEEQDKLEREREERKRKEEEEEKERRERDQRQQDELEREEERRRKEEEENERNHSKDDVARFPSPPPLQMLSTEPESRQDPEELRQQRIEERDRLLQELEQAKADRQAQEKEREECVRKAKTMQHKTTNRRNEARDMWKKRYFEEKKKTAPLEENSNRLRQELEALHRRLMNTLEGPKDKGLRTVDTKPSEKNNYVIQCTKLQHEIEDVQRRVENSKMKLTAEMKLRNQAEGELRALRAELTQKTTNMTIARQQQYAALTPRVRDQIATQDQMHQNQIDRSRASDTSAYQSSDSSRVLRAF